MALFTRKRDPLTEREQSLQAQIASLETEIRKLNTKAEQYSRGNPHAWTASHSGQPLSEAAAAAPIFEPVDQKNVKAPTETVPAHYNELGVRKLDLAGSLRRVAAPFRSAETSNPKLVSYLAAGSIQGLRPLRYERRVARNRFLLLSGVFFLLLWGILAVILRAH